MFVLKPCLRGVDTTRDTVAHNGKCTVQNASYTCLEPDHQPMHPYMPFVTEGWCQGLGDRPERMCLRSSKPHFLWTIGHSHFAKAEKEWDAVFEGTRILCFIAHKKTMTASIQPGTISLLNFFESEKSTIVALSKGVSKWLILECKLRCSCQP